MLTHLGHINSMSHAIGGPPDSRLSLWEVYNQAGRALFTEHPWNWRTVTPVDFPAVANQDFIELGDDFGNPVHVTVKGSPLRVNQTTLRTIMEMKNSGGSGGIWITFEGNAVRGPQGGGGRRMFVFPMTTAAGVPTFRIAYECMWREAREDKADAYPNIPQWMDAALDYKARSLARMLVRQASTIETAMYAEEIARCKAEDGRIQIDFGPIRGGADDYAGRGFTQGVTSVGFSNAPTS